MPESKTKMTRELSPPESAGSHFRVLCMTGKNKGIAYFLNSHRVLMGRSPAADIQILDEKSSREHGELVKNEGTYILTDLKSSNGIIVNNAKTIQKRLEDGDTIVIGKVVFKFNIYKNRNKKHLVKNEDENNENDVQEDSKEKKGNNKKVMIYGVALLGLVLLLFDDEPARKPASNEQSRSDFSNNSLVDVVEKYSNNQKSDRESINNEYIHRGQREFREGNYFRAIDEFNMALILDPNDGDAGFYLNKTKQALNNHIKFMFEKGGREYDQLKYSGAIKSYCEIVKLLYKYPNDERFKNAKEQVKVVGKKMRIEEEEYRCWGDESSED